MQKNQHIESLTGRFKAQMRNKTMLIGAFLFLSSGLYAQTFPPPGSCTSKDLELVGASLPGVAPCNSCVQGTTVTRTLNLSINNKTGSTRTSFAYWGTLEVYNDNGTLDSLHSGPFSGCVGPVPSNSITTIASNSVTYICGQSLKLTNLYLAWTDASPNSTCASLLGSTSTINPKCGTLPVLAINAGVNAIATATGATCTSNGNIVVTPNGGTPPYTVNLGAVNYTGVTTSATFSNLAPANYTVTITDANGCTVTKVRTVNPASVLPPAPVSGGNQTVCEASPIQTLTATATGTNVTWYNSLTNGNLVANPTLNTVGTATYYAQSTLGTCVSPRTPVVLTINPTPAAPVNGGNQTVCELSPIQTLTAAATGSNVTWYDAATNGNLIANPILNSVGTATYYAQATLGACVSSRTAVSLTINPTPAAPVSGGNQTVCELSPIQTLTASATGSNVTWYDAATNGNQVANPILNSVGTATYYTQATLGTCVSSRIPVSLTINPTPSAPVSGGNKTACESSPIQTLTATVTGTNVTWYDAATNGNLIANPILNSVGTVTYYAQSTLGSCPSSRTAVSLTINPSPAPPVSGGNLTECELSPVQTLTASATGINVTWYTAATGGNLVANPILNAVGSATYYAQSTLGTCKSLTRTQVKLKINPSPAPPVSGGDQAECKATPIQTLTATATGSNVTWYKFATGGTSVLNPTLKAVGSITYYAQSKLGSCNSLTRTPVSLTIYPNPANPVICVAQPSLCGPATGSITFLSPLGAGYLYSIDSGTNWQAGVLFDNLLAGSVTGILVNDQHGCKSGTISCDASNCPQPTGSQKMNNETETGSNNQPGSENKNVGIINDGKEISYQEASVLVNPNPFTDKVKFEVVVPQSGNGTLEIFNVYGQKITTVFSGFIPAGINNFELNLPDHQHKSLVYKLTTDKNLITGKFYQIGN